MKLTIPARRFAAWTVVLGIAATAWAGCQSSLPRQDPIGQVFPEVSGESLAGEQIALPLD